MSAETRSEMKPMLSILIPAYNYASGVRRIVSPLLSEIRTDIEILIHDDSSNDSVATTVNEFGPQPCLHYSKNSPPLGAVQNWNGLLEKAQGRYVILIHHDDFPLSENFASDLLEELEKHDWPDALVLSCLAYDAARKKVVPCLCNAFRAFAARHFPAYLFRRNIIGPPSVLIVRRDLFEGYDPELKWLVDVEAFFRFLKAQPRKLYFSQLTMVSSTGLPDAITTTIRQNVGEITAAELAYLEKKYPEMKHWAVLRKTFCYAGIPAIAEKLLWAMIKAAAFGRDLFVRAPCTAALRRARMTEA